MKKEPHMRTEHCVESELYGSCPDYTAEHKLWGAVAERFLADLSLRGVEGDWARYRREAAGDWANHREVIIERVFVAAGFSEGMILRLIKFCDDAVNVCTLENGTLPSPTDAGGFGMRGKRRALRNW